MRVKQTQEVAVGKPWGSGWLIACGDEGLLSSQSHSKLHILEIWCCHSRPLPDSRHLKDIRCVQV